jgi:hypothetical protein
MTGAGDSKAVDRCLVIAASCVPLITNKKKPQPKALVALPRTAALLVGPSLDQPVPSLLTRVLRVSLTSFMPVSALMCLFNDIKWICAFLTAHRERELLRL